MLFKFKSKTHSDLIILEEGGKLVLSLIGKEAQAQGIIEVADMDKAIAVLEKVIHEHGVGEHAAPEEHQKSRDGVENKFSGRDSNDSVDPVTIKQRVIPFLEMIKTCHADGQPIVWGV